MIKRICIYVIVLMFFCSCAQTSSNQQNDNPKIVKDWTDECDNPDADISCCFVNTPASLTNIMTIAGVEEAGEKLIITGIIYKPDGVTPYPDVILYCYHTDSKGYYSKKGNERGVQKWHGRLHGWCKTDSNGRYEIHSIRPAPYPDGSIPAHIHAAVKTSSGQMLYINDFVFADDPLVNKKYLTTLIADGGTGIVEAVKSPDNVWTGKRDIILSK